MNWLELTAAWLDTSRAATGIAVNWLIQSTLLVTAGLLLGHLLRNRGSAVQSAIYRTTLVAVLVCPLATWALSLAGISGWSLQMPTTHTHVPLARTPLAAAALTSEPIVAQPATPLVDTVSSRDRTPRVDEPGFEIEFDLSPLPFAENQLAASLPTEAIAEQTQPAAAETIIPVETSVVNLHRFGIVATAAGVLWLAAGGFLLCRLSLAWWNLNRLRRRAWAAEPPTLKVCRELAAMLDVSPPEVLHSPYLPSPCLAGLRRPAVLLPEAEMSLPVRDVLVHELAHVRRHDCWWNLLRRVATALLFFQPLLWKLSRRLDSTAEEVCDDYVVQFGGDRHQYAHRLVDIAELSLAPAAAAGVAIVSLRSMLATRVARIMDTSRSLSTRAGRLLVAMVLLGGLIATLLVGLVGIKPDHAAAETPKPEVAAEEKPDGATADIIDSDVFESDSDDLITIRGHVVGPDGQPFAGAAVQVSWLYWSSELNHVSLATTTSGEDGHFTISYRKSQFDANLRRPNVWNDVTIVASADGFGPAWIERNKLSNGQQPRLQLARDDVPVTGRVVDLEGNPIAGVNVRIKNLYSFANEDLTPFLDSLRRGELNWQAANRQASNKSIPRDATRLPAAVTTDADGRFRINGVGRERRVAIELRGPGVAVTNAEVATRPMEPIDANTGVADPEWTKKITLYGADFEIAAPPTQPITGIVRDAATGQPLPGVDVHSYRMTDRGMSAQKAIRVTSDANGRYRLVGMPKGTGRQIIAVPNDEQPYLMREFDVPDEPGLEAVELDLELHRGVWITGHVTDKDTGKPLGSPAQVWLYYLPYRSNLFADALPEYDVHGNVDGYQDRYTARADGSYRLVGLPGKAIVGVSCWNMSYPQGMGSESIIGIDETTGHFPTFRAPLSPSRKWPTAMKEVDITEGADAIKLDFELDPGRSLEIKMVDPRGQELSDVSILALAERDYSWQTSETPTVKALAFAPHERRTMLFHHKERNLGQVIRAQADGNSPQSITVKLEPCATIRGQLVDDNDQPITDASIRFDVLPGGDFEPGLSNRGTDSEGRFEHPSVLPGANYAVLVESPRLGFKIAAKEVAVKPGETIDLGTIDITSDKRPEPTRMMAPTANADVSRTSQDNESDRATVEASGRVLNPDGTPAFGAEVLFAPRFGAMEADLKVRATTGDDGRFQFTFPQSDLARLAEGLRPPWSSPYIVARRKGSGPVRKHIVKPADANDISLQLVADDVPIKGRIVNLEGQPLANAALRVLRMEGNPNGKLDAWLQGFRNFGEFWNGSDSWLQESISQDVSGLPAEVRTDADGRFTLRGMGRDRVVDLRLEAPQIESTEISVMSRADGALSVPLEKENPDLGTYVLYNSTFTHSAAPSQPVEGVVRDADSGEPIAGVTLYCEKRAGRDIHGRYPPETKSDERGRYVLNGLPKGADNQIAVVPPAGTPYMHQNLVIDTSQGLETKTVDIELRAAAVIRGRITDEATGNPAANARVEYFAAIANESLNDYPGFRDADDITTTTDADGHYEIVGLPGRGFLAIRAASDEFAAGQKIDVNGGDYDENPGRFRAALFRTHPHTCIADQHHAVAAVDVPVSKTEFNRDIALSRGVARRARILDPEGNPLAGVEVNRRGVYACQWYGGDVTLDNAEFIVQGLDREKPRSLFLKQAARGLVGAFVVTAHTKEPIEMRLQPAGSLAGRLVDEDGKPLAHTTLNGRLAEGQGQLDGFFFRSSTDETGRFRAGELIPGLKYEMLYHRSEREYLPIKPKAAATADLTVAAGEVNELGDVQAFDPRANAPTQSAQNATQKPKPKPAAAAPMPAAAANNRIHIRGRVLDPAGKPVAGARLFTPRIRDPEPWSLDAFEQVERARSDNNGAFQFDVPDGDLPKQFEAVPVLAYASGYGVAGNEVPREAKTPATPLALQLVVDEIVRGRVIDSEGRPVKDAKLQITILMVPKEDELEKFFTGWRQNWHDAPHGILSRLNIVGAGEFGRATTDADGRFELRGLGADRVAWLQISGAGIAQAVRFVVTRDGVDYDAMNQATAQRNPPTATMAQQVVQLVGPTFEFVAEPGQTITGTVRSSGGEPIAGVRMQALTGWDSVVTAVTDSSGHYRLSGLQKGRAELVGARAPSDSAFLDNTRQVADDKDDLLTENVDFVLSSGVVVTGRVIDAKTGEGVPAGVRFAPLPANEYFDKPGYDGFRHSRVMETSDAEGRFRLVTIPGPGMLLVQAHSQTIKLGDRRVNPYRSAEPSDADLGRLSLGGDAHDRHFECADGSIEFIRNQNAMMYLDNAPESEPETVEISLERGSSIEVLIEGPQGEPLSDVIVAGMTASWPITFQLTDSKGTLYALDPTTPREVIFFHPQRQLVAVQTVRGDELSPHSIRLAPAAVLTGRAVDDDGEPVALTDINLSYPSDTARALVRFLQQQGPPARTDAEGRFKIAGVLPELRCRLMLAGGRMSRFSEPVTTPSTSESKSLDDVVIKSRN